MKSVKKVLHSKSERHKFYIVLLYGILRTKRKEVIFYGM